MNKIGMEKFQKLGLYCKNKLGYCSSVEKSVVNKGGHISKMSPPTMGITFIQTDIQVLTIIVDQINILSLKMILFICAIVNHLVGL